MRGRPGRLAGAALFYWINILVAKRRPLPLPGISQRSRQLGAAAVRFPLELTVTVIFTANDNHIQFFFFVKQPQLKRHWGKSC